MNKLERDNQTLEKLMMIAKALYLIGCAGLVCQGVKGCLCQKNNAPLTQQSQRVR